MAARLEASLGRLAALRSWEAASSRAGMRALDANPCRTVCREMDLRPWKHQRSIHVAGSKGKGTVCALLGAALRSAGSAARRPPLPRRCLRRPSTKSRHAASTQASRRRHHVAPRRVHHRARPHRRRQRRQGKARRGDRLRARSPGAWRRRVGDVVRRLHGGRAAPRPALRLRSRRVRPRRPERLDEPASRAGRRAHQRRARAYGGARRHRRLDRARGVRSRRGPPDGTSGGDGGHPFSPSCGLASLVGGEGCHCVARRQPRRVEDALSAGGEGRARDGRQARRARADAAQAQRHEPPRAVLLGKHLRRLEPRRRRLGPRRTRTARGDDREDKSAPWRLAAAGLFDAAQSAREPARAARVAAAARNCASDGRRRAHASLGARPRREPPSPEASRRPHRARGGQGRQAHLRRAGGPPRAGGVLRAAAAARRRRRPGGARSRRELRAAPLRLRRIVYDRGAAPGAARGARARHVGPRIRVVQALRARQAQARPPGRTPPL